MATHSSVLAWRIPGTVEPGGLPSMGLHRVRQDWSDLAAAAAAAAEWIIVERVSSCGNESEGSCGARCTPIETTLKWFNIYQVSLFAIHQPLIWVPFVSSDEWHIPHGQDSGSACFPFVLSFLFFSLVLPVYGYQPISLHPHACVLNRVTPWTAAHQVPLSMDFSRQEYWVAISFSCSLFH